MPKFGKQSLDRLATCHPDLQKVMNEAIKHFDFTVLYGYRTPNEQFELYKKGRTFQNGKWVKTGTTVTNLDGKTKLSNHNYSPSTAIDIAPYQVDWNDTDKFKTLYDNPPSPWFDDSGVSTAIQHVPALSASFSPMLGGATVLSGVGYVSHNIVGA